MLSRNQHVCSRVIPDASGQFMEIFKDRQKNHDFLNISHVSPGGACFAPLSLTKRECPKISWTNCGRIAMVRSNLLCVWRLRFERWCEALSSRWSWEARLPKRGSSRICGRWPFVPCFHVSDHAGIFQPEVESILFLMRNPNFQVPLPHLDGNHGTSAIFGPWGRIWVEQLMILKSTQNHQGSSRSH